MTKCRFEEERDSIFIFISSRVGLSYLSSAPVDYGGPESILSHNSVKSVSIIPEQPVLTENTKISFEVWPQLLTEISLCL